MQNKNGSDVPEDFLASLLGALDELSELGPDDQISDEASAAFGELLDRMNEENERFLAGDFAMDAAVLVKLHKAADLFKRFEENGFLRVAKVYAEAGLSPAYIEAVSDGLVLSGEDREAFADALESCSGYEILPDTEGKLHISVQFNRLWVKIGEDKDGI